MTGRVHKSTALSGTRRNPPVQGGRRVLPKKIERKIWTMKKADTEFSKFIRERDKRCQRCGKEGPLTCSHFWGRAHKGTRYDPKNCVAICWFPCHAYHWEKEKQGAYRDFMLYWLGEEEYEELKKRALTSYSLSSAIIDCMRLLNKL